MSCDRLLRVTHAEAQHIAAGLHALATYFESDNDHFDALATDNGAVDLIPAPAVYSLAEDLVSGRRTPPLSALPRMRMSARTFSWSAASIRPVRAMPV